MTGCVDIEALRAAYEDLEKWAFEGVASGAPKSIKNYPKKEILAGRFFSVLKEIPLESSTTADWSLLENLVNADWQTQFLLQKIPDIELLEVLIRPFPKTIIRCYMLVRAHRITDITMKQDVALHFFLHDEVNQTEALKVLAKSHWSATEKYAIQFWDTGDGVKQIVALDCLNEIQSPLLVEYLSKAEMSAKTVRQSARAIVAYNENMRRFKERER